MIADVNQSIAAIASPVGRGARGVIRISGPRIADALSICFQPDEPFDFEAASQNTIISGRLIVDQPIDEVHAELFYWPRRASYTRQRSAEVHTLGAAPILNEIMRTLHRCGVRQAHPGEFTLRAFLAGRLDLTQAEAVLGVIDATSQREVQVALKQLCGGLTGPVEDIHENLLNVLSEIEAGLDFADEDIEFVSRSEIVDELNRANEMLSQLLLRIDQRDLNQNRFRCVLVGRPNVGKSCLLNCLTNAQTALVSDMAGTTRDYVVGTIERCGVTVEVVDTAGLAANEMNRWNQGDADSIQRTAQQVTNEIADSAHFELRCFDGSRPLDRWEQSHLNHAGSSILIQTKCDLPSAWQAPGCHRVSSVNGEGIEELRRTIFARVSRGPQSTSEMVQSTAIRCFESLTRAHSDVAAAYQAAVEGAGEEIIAAQIRAALDDLAVVTGRIYTDDILDRIFSRFCIGK